jgi:hypothetical protein
MMKLERMTCMVRVLATACVMSCGMLGTTYAATYYVSQSGSNSNSCATAQSPGSSAKLTIAAGAACLGTSDTLLIQAGTYNERMNQRDDGFPWRSGSSGQYTRYARYQGDQVILRPTGCGVVVDMDTPSYIELDGLVIDVSQACSDTAFFSGSNSHHLRVQNSELIGTRSYPDTSVMTPFGNNHEFLRNNIHDNNNYCIYMHARNSVFDGNTIHDCGGYGVHQYTQDEPASNNTYRNNTFYNLGFNGFCADYRSCTAQALIMYSGTNNEAYNNVIYNTYGGIMPNGPNTRVYNNTIYGTTEACIIVGGSSENSIIRNNICYQTGGGIDDGGSGTVQSNNLTANPLFLNAASGDFHLQSGSPAIDQGLTLSTVHNDRDGNLRPQGGAYDIGAYEYGKQLSLPKNLRIVSTK